MGRASADAAVQCEQGKALPSQRGCCMMVRSRSLSSPSLKSAQRKLLRLLHCSQQEGGKINPAASSLAHLSKRQPQQSLFRLLLQSWTDPGQLSATMGVSQWEVRLLPVNPTWKSSCSESLSDADWKVSGGLTKQLCNWGSRGMQPGYLCPGNPLM